MIICLLWYLYRQTQKRQTPPEPKPPLDLPCPVSDYPARTPEQGVGISGGVMGWDYYGDL